MEFHRLTDDEARIICSWKYEGAYAVYDSAPYEDQKRAGRGFANPRNNLFAFRDEGRLIGYINLFEEEDKVFFGIGAAPDCCGRGYGQKMAAVAPVIAKGLFGAKPLYLEVRAWNARAIRCYEKAGFRPDGVPFTQTTPAGEGVFIRMVLDTPDPFWQDSWKRFGADRAAAFYKAFDDAPDEITGYLKAQGADKVCDAGCGCGAYARRLFALGFSVSGFDLSPDAVSLAQSLLAESGFPAEDFRVADVSYTGFPDGCFDAVVARDVLDHVSLLCGQRAARELLRIVRPGGSVLLCLDFPDNEYESEPHAVSPDGDYVFTGGKWRGMAFHPYTPEAAASLFPGCPMQLLDESETGFTAAFLKP